MEIVMYVRRTHLAGFLLLTTTLLSACEASGGDDTTTPPASPARSRIVPIVDHHQHLMSPRAVTAPAASIPDVQLPPALDRLLRARNDIMGTDDAADIERVFTRDAVMYDLFTGTWGRGVDAVLDMAGAYTTDTRFAAVDFGMGESSGYISGVSRTGDNPEPDMTFMLGLERDATGAWRIAAEYATALSGDAPYSEPVTADMLIADLDDAGIQRAVVLSIAYWFGEQEVSYPGDPYENVRAENDWTAAEVAKYPDRLVAFCGVNPLRDFALDEMRRCSTELGMPGIKLHFGAEDIDVGDPEHLARVRRVFALANELGMAIVLHARGPEYGAEQAQIIVDSLLPAVPDVVLQIAHLWGGAQVSEPALEVFAEAAGTEAGRNLWFDLTEVEPNAGHSEELMARLADRIRQIGTDRVVYGSDMHASESSPPPAVAWPRLRRELPLSDEEWADIADNVAPYLRR
jgi:predicted TIM-barrel fold metal-dependent hydrolase